MRKIVVFNLISLDGFFAGEDGNIDWHNVDGEFNEFAVAHTADFGTIIFGRTTYQLFEEFWPKVVGNKEFSPEDQKIAAHIQMMDKIVFSKTLKEVTWENTKLFHDIDPEEVRKWKKEEGKPMAIFGSGTIVQEFTNLGLIDEYRLMVNPLILGRGKPMFADIKEMKKLQLINTRTFGNGNVLLTYEPAK
jgi:dihydrofolate reductase